MMKIMVNNDHRNEDWSERAGYQLETQERFRQAVNNNDDNKDVNMENNVCSGNRLACRAGDRWLINHSPISRVYGSAVLSAVISERGALCPNVDVDVKVDGLSALAVVAGRWRSRCGSPLTPNGVSNTFSINKSINARPTCVHKRDPNTDSKFFNLSNSRLSKLLQCSSHPLPFISYNF